MCIQMYTSVYIYLAKYKGKYEQECCKVSGKKKESVIVFHLLSYLRVGERRFAVTFKNIYKCKFAFCMLIIKYKTTFSEILHFLVVLNAVVALLVWWQYQQWPLDNLRLRPLSYQKPNIHLLLFKKMHTWTVISHFTFWNEYHHISNKWTFWIWSLDATS